MEYLHIEQTSWLLQQLAKGRARVFTVIMATHLFVFISYYSSY